MLILVRIWGMRFSGFLLLGIAALLAIFWLLNRLAAGGRRWQLARRCFCGCVAAGLALLLWLDKLSVTIEPNFGWYLFCGFCLALSVIAPGMSFSTLLMPLGLYTPFVSGIGHLDLPVIVPGVLGAIVTIICLAKAVNYLFKRHYSVAFHAIIGIVIAATLVIIPFGSFTASAASCAINAACLAAGVAAALLISKFNARHSA